MYSEMQPEPEFYPTLEMKPKFEFVSGTEIREPYEGRGDSYRPYEATALIFDEDHQNKAWNMLNALIQSELCDIVAPKTLDFISHSIEHRMIARDGSNSSSFSARLHRWRGIFSASCSKARRGMGSFRDNDIARRIYGMASVEYGNLTIIGDKRSEHLEAMEHEALELIGKEKIDSEVYGIQIVGFDRDPATSNHIGAVRVQMKRRLGTLDDGTEVKQRTLAIIDLSPNSGFDQDIVKKILDASKAETENILETVPEFNNVMNKFVKDGLDHYLVLARNETIYGYNEKTDKLVRKKKNRTKLSKLAINNLSNLG